MAKKKVVKHFHYNILDIKLYSGGNGLVEWLVPTTEDGADKIKAYAQNRRLSQDVLFMSWFMSNLKNFAEGV